MKVLLISGEFPPLIGGVGDYTACLAASLCDMGVQVAVLTSRAAGRSAFPFPVRAEVPNWDFGCWARVRREIARHRPDLVHIQYQAAAYGLHPAINLLPALLRLTDRGIRALVTFHDLRVPYVFPKAGPLREKMLRLMARGCRGVICTDAADLDSVSRWSLRSRAFLIPIGSNIPVAPADPKAPAAPGSSAEALPGRLDGVCANVLCQEDVLILGYFGLLNQSKGVELLLRAYHLVRQRGKSLRLVMIGADLGDSDPTNVAYARRVRAMASELDVDGSICWTGRLTAADTSRALQGLDFCVLPYVDGASFRRGTLMAALSHGLPVITTAPSYHPVGGDGPSLSDGENCRLVLPGDVGQLAEAIEELASSVSLRERLAAGAIDLARHFTWGEIARQTVAAYAAILSSGP
ncbi:MAG: glycosyltransferase family 4 protein [Dehalococcoidia bacterium]|nr:glycosyltransferase family 4 protein [Dehalococcoidia bacterium]